MDREIKKWNPVYRCLMCGEKKVFDVTIALTEAGAIRFTQSILEEGSVPIEGGAVLRKDTNHLCKENGGVIGLGVFCGLQEKEEEHEPK